MIVISQSDSCNNRVCIADAHSFSSNGTPDSTLMPPGTAAARSRVGLFGAGHRTAFKKQFRNSSTSSGLWDGIFAFGSDFGPDPVFANGANMYVRYTHYHYQQFVNLGLDGHVVDYSQLLVFWDSSARITELV